MSPVKRVRLTRPVTLTGHPEMVPGVELEVISRKFSERRNHYVYRVKGPHGRPVLLLQDEVEIIEFATEQELLQMRAEREVQESYGSW